MIRSKATLVSGIALSAALMGFTACSAEGPAGDESLGALDVQAEQASLRGSFALDDSTMTFSSAEVAADEFDIVVELNGMTLAALVDRAGQVAEIDGFAAGGADTQMGDADRVVLDAFMRALATEVDTESFGAAAVLYRVVSNWSQTPDTVSLQRQVAGSENRDYVSLCAYFGQYLEATHDGNKCDYFDPNCTSIAQVGNRLSPTYSYINGTWTTATPDHLNRVYQTGDCYGNCGASCPGSDPQTLTLDCHDHDQCVRNGHFIASFYCNDEFTSASDDEFFAPRCSGT